MKRLSGWVRLWLVFAVLVWLFDLWSLSVFFRDMYPFDAAELTAIAVPFVIIALIPLFVVLVFNVAKWVWRGFRPVNTPRSHT